MVGIRTVGQGQPGGSSAPLSKRDIRAYRHFKRLNKKLSLPKAQRGKEIDNDSTLEERWLCCLDGQSGEPHTRLCLWHRSILYRDNGDHEVRCADKIRECPHILHIAGRLPTNV